MGKTPVEEIANRSAAGAVAGLVRQALHQPLAKDSMDT